MNDSLFWLSMLLLCLAVQGFFSMIEMASVSFNRVRLGYYASKNIQRALWLEHLLQNPSRLFGTIMLGVNVALQVGSQVAREFYHSVGLDPDLAALTQVFLVVIFAEIVPLLAARRSPEPVAMSGAALVYAASFVAAPFIWMIEKLTQAVSRLFGKQGEELKTFISREELQKVLESHEEENEFNSIVRGIFSVKNITASHVMLPLSKVELISASANVGMLRKRMLSEQLFIPLYEKIPSHIVAIANMHDLMQLSDQQTLRPYGRPPWFITASTTLMPILAQFRSNKQTVAVVLDPSGSAVGLLTLDAILEEVFGTYSWSLRDATSGLPLVIHRTFPGNTKIADFNKEYGTQLASYGVETLAQLLVTFFDHSPAVGDTVVINGLELIVEETTFRGIKSITIKSV